MLFISCSSIENKRKAAFESTIKQYLDNIELFNNVVKNIKSQNYVSKIRNFKYKHFPFKLLNLLNKVNYELSESDVSIYFISIPKNSDENLLWESGNINIEDVKNKDTINIKQFCSNRNLQNFEEWIKILRITDFISISKDKNYIQFTNEMGNKLIYSYEDSSYKETDNGSVKKISPNWYFVY